MDNGSWLAGVLLPPLILLAGICGAITLIGQFFAVNQLVGLMISGLLAQLRRTQKPQPRGTSARLP